MNKNISIFTLAEHGDLSGRLKGIQELLRGVNQTLQTPANGRVDTTLCAYGREIARATRALQDKLENDYVRLGESEDFRPVSEFYGVPDPEHLL